MGSKQRDIEIIAIFWPPRHGKSMLAAYLASDRIDRIYGNLSIKLNDFPITSKITHHSQYAEFTDSETPWYNIVDELGLNFNSKDAMTKKNKAFSNYIFLSWKRNLSTMWLAQRWMSIPVDFRENATTIYECKKIDRWHLYPIFEIVEHIQLQDWTLEEKKSVRMDLIKWLEVLGISYDTFETSYIE